MSDAPTFDTLIALDAVRATPFRFQRDGVRYTVKSPTEMTFAQVLLVIARRAVPGTPRMPFYQRELLFVRWAAHHDLPSLPDAQRLVYLVDRYRAALEFDLHNILRVDLTTMWRERQWRRLLNFIDRLPGHCYYSEAVSNDPEHAAMLAEALEARAADGESSDPSGPPLHTWTPEVAMAAEIVDAVRHLDYVLRAVNSDPKGAPPKMAPQVPRPTSALEAARKRATFQRRQSKHEALTKRLLPHKQG